MWHLLSHFKTQRDRNDLEAGENPMYLLDVVFVSQNMYAILQFQVSEPGHKRISFGILDREIVISS
jgi:hypothetical protein